MDTTTAPTEAVGNLHVRELTPLQSPLALKSKLPTTDSATHTVTHARATIRKILRHEDPRQLVVIGPCSIHDPAAALDYARRLQQLHDELSGRLFLIMRAYLEKPRTTVGWRGLINDPQLDGSFDMSTGLEVARRLLIEINSMGLPIATEMLDSSGLSRKFRPGDAGIMAADLCARSAVNAFRKRRAYAIPGALNQLMAGVIKVLPHSWVLPHVARMYRAALPQ